MSFSCSNLLVLVIFVLSISPAVVKSAVPTGSITTPVIGGPEGLKQGGKNLLLNNNNGLRFPFDLAELEAYGKFSYHLTLHTN